MAPTKKQAVDRRAFTRVPHSTRAVLSGARGEVEARVVDLSVAGLQLEVCSALHCGEFVRVRLPLSPGDETSWVDPDALVVRSEPSPTEGCNRVGLSFLALSPAVLERLSNRVAESLAAEGASNDAPSTFMPAAAAQAAEPSAPSSAPKRAIPPKKPAPPAAQKPARKPSAPKATHPAPSAAASQQAKKPGIAQTLARLFGRGNKTASAPPKRATAAPVATPDAPASPAELRNLFRSAVASMDGENPKRRKP